MENIEKLIESLSCMGVIEGRAATALAALIAENERLQAQLAAERAKYAELQRYNVDCTKRCGELQIQLTEAQRREQAAAEDSIFRCCKTCWKRGHGYNGSCRNCKYCEFVPDGFKRGQRDLWAYCGPAAEEREAE